MGLREQAQADVRTILENEEDAGWPITLTDPAGLSKPLVGFSADIFREYDEDGNVVSLRASSVALPISAILEAGFSDLPEGVADADEKPWRTSFEDVPGNNYEFKVRESHPDRTVGLIVLILEEYTP